LSAQIDVRYVRPTALTPFLRRLGSPEMVKAAAIGLNEHAAEQRLQAITRVAEYTGVPAARMAAKTRVIKAVPAGTMTATVETKDEAIGLAEYGKPVWVRDKNPFAGGQRGGSVSSMAGAEATAWNIRRVFKGSFMVHGRVVIRTGEARFPLRTLYAAVLPNELAKPTRPNVPAAERFVQQDLETRVARNIVRFLSE